MASSAIHLLPEAQAALLRGLYDGQIAARRRRNILGVLALIALIGLAGGVGEVSLPKFIANIGNFTSYIGRLFYLDSGDFVFTQCP